MDPVEAGVNAAAEALGRVLERSAPRADALIATAVEAVRRGEPLPDVLAQFYLEVWIALCTEVGTEIQT